MRKTAPAEYLSFSLLPSFLIVLLGFASRPACRMASTPCIEVVCEPPPTAVLVNEILPPKGSFSMSIAACRSRSVLAARMPVQPRSVESSSQRASCCATVLPTRLECNVVDGLFGGVGVVEGTLVVSAPSPQAARTRARAAAETRRDETRRDETRRDETRRDETRRERHGTNLLLKGEGGTDSSVAHPRH